MCTFVTKPTHLRIFFCQEVSEAEAAMRSRAAELLGYPQRFQLAKYTAHAQGCQMIFTTYCQMQQILLPNGPEKMPDLRTHNKQTLYQEIQVHKVKLCDQNQNWKQFSSHFGL